MVRGSPALQTCRKRAGARLSAPPPPRPHSAGPISPLLSSRSAYFHEVVRCRSASRCSISLAKDEKICVDCLPSASCSHSSPPEITRNCWLKMGSLRQRIEFALASHKAVVMTHHHRNALKYIGFISQRRKRPVRSAPPKRELQRAKVKKGLHSHAVPCRFMEGSCQLARRLE